MDLNHHDLWSFSYLDCFLHVFRIVLFNIMMRTNGMFQFFVNNDSWTLCTWTSNEQHNSSADIRIECLIHEDKVMKNSVDQTEHTSRRPIATDKAAPVDRKARLPCGTGHGSRWSSPRRSVNDMSHADNGWINLEIFHVARAFPSPRVQSRFTC